MWTQLVGRVSKKKFMGEIDRSVRDGSFSCRREALIFFAKEAHDDNLDPEVIADAIIDLL